jgi:hypothetical protein
MPTRQILSFGDEAVEVYALDTQDLDLALRSANRRTTVHQSQQTLGLNSKNGDDFVFVYEGNPYLLPSDDLKFEDHYKLLIAYNPPISATHFIPQTFRLKNKAFKKLEASRQLRLIEDRKRLALIPYQAGWFPASVAAGTLIAGAGALMQVSEVKNALAIHPAALWSSQFLFIPAFAGLGAAGLHYLMQHAGILLFQWRQATPQESKSIARQSWALMGMMSGALSGAALAQGVYPHIAGNPAFTEGLGTFRWGSGRFGVSFPGACMLVGAIGMGVGLVTGMLIQNIVANRGKQPSEQQVIPTSRYLAAFFIGSAIGAAAAIGYAETMTRYLMPLALAAGLTFLLPSVQQGSSAVGGFFGTMFSPGKDASSEEDSLHQPSWWSRLNPAFW